MRNATIALAAALLLLLATPAAAQEAETSYRFVAPPTDDITNPYTPGSNSGARGVSGPFDLDGDGRMEILVTDYSGGGRVHVIEHVSGDTWEHVYSTPWADSTGSSNNGRYAIGTDLDGNGRNEIIFVCGWGYSETNPNTDAFRPGLCVFEHTGNDNDYGTEPVAVMTFAPETPDRLIPEQFEALDVDGDGQLELLVSNNGAANTYDNWYVLSVDGEFSSGFATWVVEARVSTRESEDFDPVNRGGGSAQAMHAADLNGDGNYELSMHAWNNFNFTNGAVTGADTYVFPGAGDENVFLQATEGIGDDVSLFGGVVVDINGDGRDEVYYPRYLSQSVAVLSYGPDDDVLQVTSDNVALDVLGGEGNPPFTDFGIVAGDIDGDGQPELIGVGPGHDPVAATAGEPSHFLHVAKWVGGQEGDPKDPSNYEVTTLATPLPDDTAHFNVVVRDSLGEVSRRFEDGAAGRYFPTKLAYLGDVNDNGTVQIAVAFQGIADSSYVYDEVWNADSLRYERTTREAVAAERTFARIFTIGETGVSREADIILPSDYKLSENYPNPFNPSTTFSITLPSDRAVSVKVYDVMGRLVNTLVANELMPHGTYELTWNGTNDAGTAVASGTYFYTLEYGSFRQTRKMLLIK